MKTLFSTRSTIIKTNVLYYIKFLLKKLKFLQEKVFKNFPNKYVLFNRNFYK